MDTQRDTENTMDRKCNQRSILNGNATKKLSKHENKERQVKFRGHVLRKEYLETLIHTRNNDMINLFSPAVLP